jgi:hypothetical protein
MVVIAVLCVLVSFISAQARQHRAAYAEFCLVIQSSRFHSVDDLLCAV